MSSTTFIKTYRIPTGEMPVEIYHKKNWYIYRTRKNRLSRDNKRIHRRKQTKIQQLLQKGGGRITQKELFDFIPTTIHRTHDMADTSMHSYYSIYAELGDQQELVLDCIEENPNKNDKEITAILNLNGSEIQKTTVIARRNELVKMGYIKCNGQAYDKNTGRPAKIWEARQS